ncbi:MAG TPA: NAD-dependent epimerase/dehydratase family protein [Bryobacteraceae bacterium]|nr:NAD-dependent epimerase/dehydratase family protein [Bryobacteraceae bacterium]
MSTFITGVAGFAGSHLADRLLALGDHVTGYDNFSTGRIEFLECALKNPRFRLIRGDVLDLDSLSRAMAGAEIVFHMAANADVRFGTQHPRKDLEQNTIGTWNILEAMRTQGIRRIAFASTGSVYGEPAVFPTPERSPFPVQTSLYGASKLAAEGLIQAYCEGFKMQGFIFRFVSLLGPRYSHGHVIDFFRQLRQHPDDLSVLGDGHQRKSYLYIEDCIDAMLLAVQRATDKINIFNLGTDEVCEVDDSIGWICEHLGLTPRLTYSGGQRGWIGDNPFIFLDCTRIRELGWRPSLSIREAVIRTLQFLESNPWLT